MTIQLKQIFLCLFLIINAPSFSQHEYLVTVNPTTGALTLIDSLDEVRWIHVMPRSIAFDELNHRYIFLGQHADQVTRLFSVDVTNGDILYQPLFPASENTADNLIEFQFDHQLNTLFGLHWDASEGREYFVSINTVSGTYTLIDSIPGLQSIIAASSSYDQTNHRYFFMGRNQDGSYHNYVIDATNGHVIASPNYLWMTNTPDYVVYINYDQTLGKMYGIYWNYYGEKAYLIEINPYTGAFQAVCEIPNVKWFYGSPNYHTYDSNHHRFFFAGFDSAMKSHLFTVDTQLGEVLSTPLFPDLPDPDDNVIELQFDNSTNKLYALHWDNYPDPIPTAGNSGLSIYPNPVTDFLYISNPADFSKAVIYTSEGKEVTIFNLDENTISLDLSDLARGTYIVTLYDLDQNRVSQTKIIKI